MVPTDRVLTVEQRTLPVENCALPFPGQGQFVRPAFSFGYECVHGGSWQHNYWLWMASWL